LRCRETSAANAASERFRAYSRTNAMSSVICLNMAAAGKSEQIIFLEVLVLAPSTWKIGQ
jgi:hypothetical protein